MLVALALAGCATGGTPTTSRPTSRPATFEEVVARFEIDDRLTLCQLTQRPDRAIEGVVEMPQHRDALRAAGFDVSRVRLLPEESRTAERFGLVTGAHTILRRSPKDEPGDRENVTDLVQGELCWILDQDAAGWQRVHAADGYLGWAAPGTITPVDADTVRLHLSQAEVAKTSPKALITGVTTQPASTVDADIRAAHAAHARTVRELILSEARTFLGTQYVWGGKTRDGIDCSGLTQTAFGRHGVLLPRDANQQANVGKLVATRSFTEALLPGDLLFFLGSRRANVSHVALYLGDGRYIEAATKAGVRIRSMNPAHADYDEKRTKAFAWARRVLE